MIWTPELREELMSLWDGGKRTFGELSRHFKVTRSAIAGRIRREKALRGIPSNPAFAHNKPRNPSQTANPKKEKRMLTLPARAEFAIPKHTFVALPKPDEGQLASIVDVTGCRWAVSFDASAPGGHLFCNHATDGKTYCPYHSQENVASYSRRLIRETVRSAIIVNKRAA